ncbi:hypothetical protein K439DRAFT_1621253 [Ramaria rubella]|nr:hypothetical protein K439DRAFT_1621253 [Ramaria rubella]
MDKQPAAKDTVRLQPKVVLHLPRMDKAGEGRKAGGQEALVARATNSGMAHPLYDKDYKAEDSSGHSDDDFSWLTFPLSPTGEVAVVGVPGDATAVSKSPSVSPLRPAKQGWGRPHGGKVHSIMPQIKAKAAAQSNMKMSGATSKTMVLSDVITLLIPLCLLENANKRTPVSKISTFDTMMSEVHQAMGCKDVPAKPTLMYKLFGATKSSSADCLIDKGDWRNLIKQVEEGEYKKQEAVVYIVITEKYLAALTLYLKGTKVTGKRKCVKSPPLDLSMEGPDEGLVDNGTVDKWFSQLQITWDCQACGTWCLAAPGLGHQVLSSTLLKSWAYSLASNTPKVTLARPPVEGFEKFFKTTAHVGALNAAPGPEKIPAAAVVSVPQAVPPFTTYPPPYPYGPYGYPPLGPTPLGFYPRTHAGAPPTTPVHVTAPVASSSPFVASGEEEAPVYPECTDFMTALANLHPKRALEAHVGLFEHHGFICINEASSRWHHTPLHMARHCSSMEPCRKKLTT